MLHPPARDRPTLTERKWCNGWPLVGLLAGLILANVGTVHRYGRPKLY